MRPKSLLLLALALGCGLVASIGISQVLESRRGGPAQVETAPIYVAKLDIERSTPLSEHNIELEQWPVDKIPQGAVSDLKEVVGQRPGSKIFAGEAILHAKLGTGEGGGRSSGEIPRGFRVVSVRVDDTSGSGLILPGDRVDVQVYVRENKALGLASSGTYTFLQDVSVFAVNDSIRYDAEAGEKSIAAKTISLLVTPMQAAKVTLAAEVGRIRLVMRPQQDDEATEDTKVTFSDIFDSEKFEDKQRKVQNNSDPLSSLLDKLDQGPPSLPANSTSEELAAATPFRMVLIEGADVRVVQFDATSPVARPLTWGEGNDERTEESSKTTPSGTNETDEPDDFQENEDQPQEETELE